MRPETGTIFSILWVLSIPLSPLLAQQTDRARVEALARRAGERQQALQRETERLAAQERSLLGDLRRAEIERELKAEELRRVETERAQVVVELATNDARMQKLEQQESAARPDLRARLVHIYKLGQGRYVRLLLSTSDLRQVAQASRMVAALAKLDRERVESHQQMVEDLKKTRASLEQRSRRLEALKAEGVRAQAAAERAAQARSDLIRDIDRRRDLNAELVSELQSAQRKLQLTIRDLAGGATTVEPPTLPLGPFRGDLGWPVVGTVTRRFGRPGSDRAAASNGMEIAAAEGTMVSAVHDGLVAFADSFSGFGNLVIMDHGSRSFSLYGNLLDVSVKKGDRLERGQPLGSVGPSPAGPPGLYFELRVDGQSVDPLQWLKRRPAP